MVNLKGKILRIQGFRKGLCLFCAQLALLLILFKFRYSSFSIELLSSELNLFINSLQIVLKLFNFPIYRPNYEFKFI